MIIKEVKSFLEAIKLPTSPKVPLTFLPVLNRKFNWKKITFHNFLLTKSDVSLKWLFLLTLLFPFIPSIIPSTDTQPTFLLVFMLAVVYVMVNPSKQPLFFKWNNKLVIFFLGLIVYTVFVVQIARIWLSDPVAFTRVISFIQFLLALFFGLTIANPPSKALLQKIFLIYFIFTFVYFLSGGLIEAILIRSRGDVSAVLAGSGRGARTLSPEPSYFALHLLNLLIMFYVLYGWDIKNRKDLKVMLMAGFCLLASFSGFGLVILAFLFFLRFYKISLLGLVLLVLFSGFFVDILQSFSGIRALKLARLLLANPEYLLTVDASIVNRLASFLAYFQRISDYFVFGDGFTLKKMGGFISIVTALGFIALSFFIWFLLEVLILKRAKAELKGLIYFWFAINLLSGSIGIPTFGFIIGLIFRNNYLRKDWST